MEQGGLDGDAQMLAHIKALPEGDMKVSLLDYFLKSMVNNYNPT